MKIVLKLIKTVYNDFSDIYDVPAKKPTIRTLWFILDVDKLDGNKVLNI